MNPKDPQTVTISGRLSFPAFTMAEALALNATSDYVKADDKVTPTFSMLVEVGQVDKLITHIKDHFLPWVAQRHADGEKRNALDPKQVQKILNVFDDLDDQPPHIPIKPVSERNAEAAPEAAATVKVRGQIGQDLILKAVVRDDNELVVPDADILHYPVVKPINETIHSMYPGAVVAATLNLFSFVSSGMPGISASASTVVFKQDADRFGGGVDIDEDEIFADD